MGACRTSAARVLGGAARGRGGARRAAGWLLPCWHSHPQALPPGVRCDPQRCAPARRVGSKSRGRTPCCE